MDFAIGNAWEMKMLAKRIMNDSSYRKRRGMKRVKKECRMSAQPKSQKAC
jgi:hypothetical protein